MGKLTPKQKVFAMEYIKDFNASRAYKAAYPSVTMQTAGVQGHRHLKNPKIASFITQLKRERSERVEIRADDVLRELAKVAYSDLGHYVEVVERLDPETGEVRKDIELVPTKDLPEGATGALSQVKPTRRGVEYKLHDKVRALELLAKHLGMLTDKVEVSGDSVVKIQLPDGLE